MLRALHQPRAQTGRPNAPRRTRAPPRPRRRDRRASGDDRCRHREAGVPRRLQRIPQARFRRRVRARRRPQVEPSSPRARSRLFGLVDERQPGAIDPRSRRRPSGRPGPARARPGCDTRCRGAPAAGTVPTPGAGARAGPHRPTRPRRRGTAAAAHSPQTRPRPASHAPNPPDTAVAGRRTDQPARVLVRHQRVPDLPLLVGFHQLGSDPQPRRPCPARPPPAPAGAHPRPAPTTAGTSTRRQRDVAGRAGRALPRTDAVGDLNEAADARRGRLVQHVAQVVP